MRRHVSEIEVAAFQRGHERLGTQMKSDASELVETLGVRR